MYPRESARRVNATEWPTIGACRAIAGAGFIRKYVPILDIVA
jgi:hypothetical protein